MEITNWRVLLIGGNSGAGKTYLARALTRQWGIPFLMVDDIRIALQNTTTSIQHPDLHTFLKYRPEQWHDPDGIVQDWLRVGRAMMKPLRSIMMHHINVESSGPIIIEGDGLLPELINPGDFDEFAGVEIANLTQKARCVFLVEDDEDEILKNMQARSRGPLETNEETQMVLAQASQRYGQWLIQEAARNQMPVVRTRPKTTIVERLKQAI